MTPALRIVISALAAATVAGCPSGDDEPANVRDDPGVQPFASAVLPWGPRRTFDEEFDGGKGAKLFRNVYYRRVNEGGVQELPTLLAALVALPTSLVAVYAPDDAEGLIIAHGGIDQPWERIPLTDVSARDIGAVDAHATRDGGVVIAVRRRATPQEIMVFSWRPGGAVERIAFARPAPSPAHWTNERCEDLAVGVSPAGDLDIVFREGKELRAESRKIVHGRRAAGQSTFVFHVVEETANLPPPQTSIRYDLGCRLRLAYRPDGDLVLMSLTRELPDSAFTTLNSEIPDAPQMAVAGYTFLAGAWTRGGPSATGGGGPTTGPSSWYTAQFDVTVHPAGYTVSGLERNTLNDPELTLAIGAPPDTLPTGLVHGLDIDEGNDPNGISRVGSGGAIIVDECGGIRLWSTEGGLRNAMVDGAFSGNVSYCGGKRLAPVVKFPDDPWGFAQLPVVARGPRTYHAALCLMDEERLAICEGGFDVGSAMPGSIRAEEESPDLVASTPADGAVNVPTSTRELRVTMNRPLAADEQITVQLSDVHRGLPEFLPGPTPTGVPDELRIALPTLNPNTLYRIHVPYFRPDTLYTYVTKRAPVITFRTGP